MSNFTNTSNNTISSINNTISIIPNFQPFYPQCIQFNQNSECTRFCPLGCQRCSSDTGVCLTCARFYDKNSDNHCHFGVSYSALILVIGVLNTIRINSLQRMYFLIDDLKFHSYHKTNYTGILGEVLEVIRVF